METKPVESFKLTKEQKDFAQKYRRVKRIAKVLQGKTMQKMQELQGLSALLKKTSQGMQLMLEGAPREDQSLNGMSPREGTGSGSDTNLQRQLGQLAAGQGQAMGTANGTGSGVGA